MTEWFIKCQTGWLSALYNNRIAVPICVPYTSKGLQFDCVHQCDESNVFNSGFAVKYDIFISSTSDINFLFQSDRITK